MEITNRRYKYPRRYRGKGKYTFGSFLRQAEGFGDRLLKTGEKLGDRFLKKGLPNILAAGQMVESSGLGKKRKVTGSGLYGGMMDTSQGYTGSGSYVANSLIAGGRMAPKVSGSNNETDTITLTDCEFVRDIYAPTITAGSNSSYTQERIPVNPGLPEFAPNLSQIAINFLEYELKQLVYEIRPMISPLSTSSGQSGSLFMVFNYNPNDDPYDNKEDVMQAHGSVSGRIIDHLSMGVECSKAKTKNTEYFIRPGPVPFGKDADEYDHGVLTIASNNIPDGFSNVVIGELWVHYKVQLRKRRPGALRLTNQQYELLVRRSNSNTEGDDKLFAYLPTSIGGTYPSGAYGWGKAQQSNIGASYLLVGNSGKNLKVVLPATLNGYFEFKLMIETDNGIAAFSAAPSKTGNIEWIKSIYTTTAGANAPDYYMSVHDTWVAVYILRFKCRSATGNVDNTISLTCSFTIAEGSFLRQTSIELLELTQNTWKSKSDPQPVFLDSAGNSIIPYN